MPRTYEQVLEDTVKNQTIQIVSLIAENESIKAVNNLLAQKLNEANDKLNEANDKLKEFDVKEPVA